MRVTAFACTALLTLGAAALLSARATAVQSPEPAIQPAVETLYADAVAREAAVRRALSVERPPPTVLKAVRTVVAGFETIVRLYPASGYSDDALWRGGLTALEAFNKLGEPRDRETGVRLLRALASQYPASKLAKNVPGLIATLGAPQAAAPAAPAMSSRLSTITSIKRTVLPDVVRVTIELDGEVPFREERLDNPSRVFVDLSGARAAPAILDRTLRFDDAVELGRQIRVGRHPNNTTRVVVDAAGMTGYSIYPLYEPYRLVIDCVRPPAVRATRLPAPILPARRIGADWTGTVASPPAQGEESLRLATELPLLPAPVPPVAVPATVPPDRNLAGGFSIARQLGLRVSRIVIDPGHGGHDPGAAGKGLTEADLVLDVALRLEKLLATVPDTEVFLTRRGDEYVPLQERTAIANREGADLFLSIHANASSSAQARGVETYFLNFAQNLSAAAVAARENAASGQAMGALPDLLKTIALNNKLDESREFATYVQRAMIEKLRVSNKAVKDLGVRQAPFMVLIGAAMPSVLAEISFVTSASEVKLLKQPAYRQRIAEALFDAVRRYQGSLKRVAAPVARRD